MSDDKMLTYGETLDLVEKFMIDAEIRRYCTDICKGSCCASCYNDNEEACHRQEGRRLSCSAFICYALSSLLSEKDSVVMLRVDRIIGEEYSKYSSKNPYFKKPTPLFLKQSLFSSEIIEALDAKMAKRIKKIITILIVTERNIRLVNTNKEYIKKKIKEGVGIQRIC